MGYDSTYKTQEGTMTTHAFIPDPVLSQIMSTPISATDLLMIVLIAGLILLALCIWEKIETTGYYHH